MTPQRVLQAAAGGWLVGAALVSIVFALTPWVETGKEYPLWGIFLSETGSALIATVPGCAAGYLFAHRGSFFVGGSVGVLLTVTTYVSSAIVSWPAVILRTEVTSSFVAHGAAMCLAAFITNGIAGIAGQYLRYHRFSSRA